MLNTFDREYQPATTIHRFEYCCEPGPYCPIPSFDPDCGCIAQLKIVIAQLIALFSSRTDVSVTVLTVSGVPFTGIPSALFPSEPCGGLFILRNELGVDVAAISLCKIASIYVPTDEGLSTIGYLSGPACVRPSCQTKCESAVRLYAASLVPGTNVQLITSYHSLAEGTLYANVDGLLVVQDVSGFPSFVSTCAIEAILVPPTP